MAIEYNKKNSRRWAVIGQRPTFGLILHELAKENKDIIAIAADVTNSAGLRNMNAELPDQVINVGIAEQNMMGIATGLASEGYTVYTTTFAPFQAMRCLEQIRVNQGYMGQKVIMVGLAGGVAYGELGFTHCTIEDVSILRSIPNIAVVTPADAMEVAKIVEAAANYDKSVYIRLMDKTNIPVVYTEDYEFEIGKAVRLIEGGEVALLANGPLVNVALKASKKYTEETGVNVAVYDFHTVKPIDEALLNELADNVKSIITLEEHSVIGGLGSAVADYYSDKSVRPLVYKMGLPDAFPHGASHETILAEFNLTVDGVYNKIKEVSK
jgi:transketolase